jgi:hypothetical protein
VPGEIAFLSTCRTIVATRLVSSKSKFVLMSRIAPGMITKTKDQSAKAPKRDLQLNIRLLPYKNSHVSPHQVNAEMI